MLVISFATAPTNSINYKAIIKDVSSNILANQTIDVRFAIIGNTGPINVYVEIHTGVTTINNKIYDVIPLCHPRQADRLGSFNAKWGKLYDHWLKQHNEE